MGAHARGIGLIVLQERKAYIAELPRMSEIFAAPVTEASKIGMELRAARLQLGWTLKDLAAGLCIREPYLHALEQGCLQKLPGRAYAIGFLRTYAQSLGLDGRDLARRFQDLPDDINPPPALNFPEPAIQSGLSANAMIVLGLFVAIVSYTGWYNTPSGGTSTVQAVPEIPSRFAALIAPHAAVSPQIASLLPGNPATTSLGAAAIIPQSNQTEPSSAIASTAADPDHIVLRAKTDSWVQVRDRMRGAVILSRVLHSGESWSVPSRPELLLTTGNAGGTELMVNGVPMAPLGDVGVVRRDLPLNMDNLRRLANAAEPGLDSTPRSVSQ